MNIVLADTEPLYTIGVAAKKFNVSVHTLRLYETEGLILPHKTATNRRLYSKSDLNRIACIRYMIEQKGHNIAGIKAMLALIPCWQLLPCSEADRNKCAAFTATDKPCWMSEHKAQKCQELNCNTCHVYQSLAGCDNFKAYLKENWR